VLGLANPNEIDSDILPRMGNSIITGELRQSGSKASLIILRGRKRWKKDYVSLDAAAIEARLVGLPQAAEQAARSAGTTRAGTTYYAFTVPDLYDTDLLIKYEFNMVKFA
jgi:hypothetical protein